MGDWSGCGSGLGGWVWELVLESVVEASYSVAELARVPFDGVGFHRDGIGAKEMVALLSGGGLVMCTRERG